ncbi:MAG: Ig-like domain-containing protein [candidate division WOR-3 bacterium]
MKILNYLHFVIVIGLVLLGCAKKMLPPSPDRFPPQLLEIDPKTSTRLDLIFNEDIVPVIDSAHRLYITNNIDTLQIIAIITKGSRVSLYTRPLMTNTRYQIRGSFMDQAGNAAVIKKTFRSALQPDTVDPRVTSTYPKPGSVLKVFRGIYIDFTFSEPVDSQSDIHFTVSPLAKNKIKYEFSNDRHTLTFLYPDTLTYRGLIYFLLLPSITDLANNRLKNFGYTYFTTDSTLTIKTVRGKLLSQNIPVSNGIVIFERDNLKAFTITEKDGTFSCQLELGTYSVSAIADTNWDFYVDLISAKSEIAVDTTQIEVPTINLFPAATKIYLNEYLN